jgi:hypothetical protein
MKITSVCASNSDAKKLVLRTEPPLTAEVLNHFRTVQQRQALAGLAFSADAGCLVVHNVIPTSMNIDSQVADDIRQLLNAAEEAANNTERIAREAVEREQAERRASVESAARAFGVPAQ